MKLTVYKAVRCALNVLIELYESHDFELNEQDKADFERLKDEKRFFDGKIAELINKESI